VKLEAVSYAPKHFGWSFDAGVATVTLHRPERKNPLTFESYAELRDTFRDLVYAPDVKAVVVTGAGGNFSSGGDVHEIIGPLTRMSVPELLNFTRMTGDLVQGDARLPAADRRGDRRHLRRGRAIMAMAADLRLATPEAKTAFLFTRVGLAAATWAPARSSRASSVRAALPTCSSPAAR
jgi:enoyl-CoA hydratase/carnithine racemase